MPLLDTLSLIGSLLLIVLILVATYYATRWYVRRMQGGSGRYIKVLDRTAMGQRCSVALVQVGEKFYLLGVGEKNVVMLDELEDFQEQPPSDSVSQTPAPKAFRELLDKARGRLEKKDDGGTG